MSAGWPERRCLGARGVLVGVLLALVGVGLGAGWGTGEETERRGRELGGGRAAGVERVVVREPAAALRGLFGLARAVGADEGGRAGPLAVVAVVALLLGGAWGGRRVVPGGGWRRAAEARVALGSRAPPRVRHV